MYHDPSNNDQNHHTLTMVQTNHKILQKSIVYNQNQQLQTFQAIKYKVA